MPAPFPADQVGSLLRPQYLLDAQNAVLQFGMHNTYQPNADPALITAAHEAEAKAITDVVHHQLTQNVAPITTGEFARASFVSGFFETLAGITIRHTAFADAFRTDFPIARPYLRRGFEGRDLPIATAKVRWERSAYMDEWVRLRALVGEERWGMCKMTVPSPAWTALQVRVGRAWEEGVYVGETAEEEYCGDCGEAVRREILALYEAGCRYIQIDDPMIAMLVDAAYLTTQRHEGNSLATLLKPAILAHRAATRSLPPELNIAIHLCRGNNPKGDTVAIGGFDAILPVLFRELPGYGRWALEFDDPAVTGGMEVLSSLPRGKVVVLGLVTTKTNVVESVGEVKERVMEAARVVARGQGRGVEEVLGDSLAVSPSCGFASLNFLHGVDAEETQWKKLKVVRQVAEEVFGSGRS